MPGALQALRAEGPITAKEVMEGPTPNSNWVLPNTLLVGDVPAGDALEMLLDYGVTTFVDLGGPASKADYLERCAIEVPPEVSRSTFDLATVINAPTSAAVQSFAAFTTGVVGDALDNERIVYVHAPSESTSAAFGAAVLAHVYGVSAMKATTIVAQQNGCRPQPLLPTQLFPPPVKAFCRDAVDGMARCPTPSQSTTPSPSAPQQQHPQQQQHQQRQEAQRAEPQSHPTFHRPPTPVSQQPSPQTGVSPATSFNSHSNGAHASPVRPLDSSSLSQSHTALPPGQPSPSPASRPTSARFAHTPGHGGGRSQINLFGSDDSAGATTPSRRAGRAKVGNSPEAKKSVHASSQENILELERSLGDSASSLPPPDVPPMLDPRRNPELVRGPTSTSNWVVGRVLCCGARPQPQNRRSFSGLVAQRFTKFVVLTEKDESPSYLTSYCEQSGGSATVRFCAMNDGEPLNSSNVDEFMSLVREVVDDIRNGAHRVYVHCFGGHGRTGMFISAVLAFLYRMSAMKALNLCNALHDCREATDGQASPQTQEQRTCVMSLLTARAAGV